MDFSAMIGDAFEYTKEALWEKWVRWILLLVSCIIFPLILGYVLEIMRGKKPAPELENWGKLFIDGLKMFVIEIIYAIPVILVILLFGGLALFGALGSAPSPDYYSMHPERLMPFLGTFFVGLLFAVILAIIISLISIIGIIRFARTDSMGEAFNFSAILAHIGKIGWISYVVALVIVIVVYIVVAVIISLIPFIGSLINFIIMPAYTIFIYRYFTLVYDSVPA